MISILTNQFNFFYYTKGIKYFKNKKQTEREKTTQNTVATEEEKKTHKPVWVCHCSRWNVRVTQKLRTALLHWWTSGTHWTLPSWPTHRCCFYLTAAHTSHRAPYGCGGCTHYPRMYYGRPAGGDSEWRISENEVWLLSQFISQFMIHWMATPKQPINKSVNNNTTFCEKDAFTNTFKSLISVRLR